MQQHLELHFLGDISSDEKLLATYPSAIKRRVLRYSCMCAVMQVTRTSAGCRYRRSRHSNSPGGASKPSLQLQQVTLPFYSLHTFVA